MIKVGILSICNFYLMHKLIQFIDNIQYLNQLMLRFSNSDQTTSNANQLHFQPLVIINKLPKQVSPQKQQKFVLKANKNKGQDQFKQKRINDHDQKGNSKKSINNKWIDSSKQIGIFDKNIKKNQLAEEQRKLKNEMKRQKQLIHQQIVINQKNIKGKNINMQAEKDQEIQYLKKMIQIQRTQKIKNDKLYEQKKQQIQRERQELIQLQKKIQKEGVKSQKVVKQIKKIAEEKPMQQKVLNYQFQQSKKKYNTNNKGNYEQPTQSEILHQKNKIRQDQLAYLIRQRQKRVQDISNINYTPTLIPLLSKASYKIISTNVSSLVQLLIDDLLEEQVHLLQKIQLEQVKNKQQQKQKQILKDYYNKLQDFVNQNDQIASKVGKYQTMNFSDLYKPKHYPNPNLNQTKGQILANHKSKLNLQFDDDQIQQLQNRKDKFIRFVSSFDQYKISNMKMFQDVTQQLIQQAIAKLAKQLDKGSGQFVDIVFRNQFN